MRAWFALGLMALGCTGTTTTDAGPVTPAEILLEVRGTVRAFAFSVPPELLPRLARVEVCVWQREDLACVLTDDDGAYRLEVPEGEGALTFKKDGQVSALVPVRVGTGTTASPALLDEATGRLLANLWAVDDPYPFASTGLVFFHARDRVSGAVKPMSGVTLQDAPTGKGPFYVAFDGYDPALEATSGLTGLVAMGEVAPGTYDVTLQHPAVTCRGGWTGATEGQSRVPVAAGFLSDVSVTCETPDHVAAEGEVRASVSEQALEGVRVCRFDDVLPCVRTAADGRYRIGGLPAEADLALRFEKNGYVPVIVPVTTTRADYSSSAVLETTGHLDGMLTTAGASDASLSSTGAILVSVNAGAGSIADAPLAGATVELVGVDAAGRVYLDGNREPDVTLAATSTRGLVLFHDVPPGNHTLWVTHPEKLCTGRAFLWPADDVNRGVVPVAVGAITSAQMLCVEP